MVKHSCKSTIGYYSSGHGCSHQSVCFSVSCMKDCVSNMSHLFSESTTQCSVLYLKVHKHIMFSLIVDLICLYC